MKSWGTQPSSKHPLHMRGNKSTLFSKNVKTEKQGVIDLRSRNTPIFRVGLFPHSGQACFDEVCGEHAGDVNLKKLDDEHNALQVDYSS